VFYKVLLISIKLLVFSDILSASLSCMFPSPAPEYMVDKKHNANTKSKEMRNKLSLRLLKLGAKGYIAHIVGLNLMHAS
jgi:hypothetical protein